MGACGLSWGEISWLTKDQRELAREMERLKYCARADGTQRVATPASTRLQGQREAKAREMERRRGVGRIRAAKLLREDSEDEEESARPTRRRCVVIDVMEE